MLATATNSTLSGGLTDSGVQVLTTGDVDLAQAARAAATSGLAGGAARSGTFAVNRQARGGTPTFDRAGVMPNRFERPSHVKLTESQKGAGRLAEGLAKGGIRQVHPTDGSTGPTGPSGPAAPDAPGVQLDEMAKRPFGRPTYTVRPGDDLTTIAKALLGDGDRWRELVEGGRPAIADPDLIQPGQTITLPR